MPTEIASRDILGDAAAAVTVLYQIHAVGLIRLAVVMTGDRPAAENVVQDAFCGLFRRWPQLADKEKALACVRSAILNGCRSELRRRIRSERRAARDAVAESAESAECGAGRRGAPRGADRAAPPAAPATGSAGAQVLARSLRSRGRRRHGRLLRHRQVHDFPRHCRARAAPRGGLVNTVEERLRAAAQAAGAPWPPGSAPPLRLHSQPDSRLGIRRPPPRSGWLRWVAPLAAGRAAQQIGLPGASTT